MIKATKVKVASQTIFQTTLTSDQWTTPTSSASKAPASALHPMPNPLGCQITSSKVTAKIASAGMVQPCLYVSSEGALVDPQGNFLCAFHPLGVTVSEVPGATSCEPGEFHQLFADISDA